MFKICFTVCFVFFLLFFLSLGLKSARGSSILHYSASLQANFGHTYTLVLALFSVLLQDFDLDVLLAPRKSVFDSAILMESLVTGFLGPSLSRTFLSDDILKPCTTSLNASTGLGVLGFLTQYSICFLLFCRKHSSLISQGFFHPLISYTGKESMCCTIRMVAHESKADFVSGFYFKSKFNFHIQFEFKN